MISVKDAYFQFQKKIVIAFSLIGIVTAFVFGTIHLNAENYFVGIFEVVLAIILVMNLTSFLERQKEEPHSSLILFFIFLTFVMLVVTGGIANTGIYWVHVFPVLAYAIKRVRIGTVWTILFVIALVCLLLAQVLGAFETNYTYLELRQSIFSYSVLSLVVYFFARYLDQREKAFLVQDQELILLNGKLQTSLSSVKQARARVQGFLSSIGDGVLATDKKGKILLANPSALAMLGKRKSDVIRKNLFEVVPLRRENRRPVPKKEHPLWKVLSSEEAAPHSTPANFPHYFVGPNRELFPVSITVAPIIFEKEVTGAMLSFRDVTEELRVSQEKTDFVSIASHQLRTPLTGLKWTFQELTDDNLRKDNRELVEEAKISVDGMIRLVNNLLNVSRIELGNITSQPKRTDVVTLTKNLISEQKPAIDEKAIQLSFTPPKTKMFVLDRSLYSQVLSNLISNAIRYSKKGGVVDVSLSIEGDAFVTRVKDWGMGIPVAEQKFIFQKYFRASKAKKRTDKGTGLGLYFVKMAVDAMDGNISFTSKDGKGTEFIVQLPLG